MRGKSHRSGHRRQHKPTSAREMSHTEHGTPRGRPPGDARLEKACEGLLYIDLGSLGPVKRGGDQESPVHLTAPTSERYVSTAAKDTQSR